MLNMSSFRTLQWKYDKEEVNANANDDNYGLDDASSSRLTFDDAVSRCQSYIATLATESYRLEKDDKVKLQMMQSYIGRYVNDKKPKVQLPNSRDVYEWKPLIDALINEITKYGPITGLVEDSSVDEVRANAFDEIFYEKGGKTIRSEKNFKDKDHMERIVQKLIGVSKVRLTPKSPMVNARTSEGYRVNATHSEISPYDNYAFVLRKFDKSEITSDNMIKSKSFSRNMYELLSLIPKADLSWITVGPTGSGKTTLNELMVKEIDPMSRIITIENPSEMRLKKREGNKPEGAVINDVLQYECVPDDDDSSPATMENLLINAMRQSPHWIGPGELRTPGEFATALRASQTGHYFFTTLHAEGDREAIFRFLTSYLMAAHEPAELAMRNICSAVKFVIFQEKLADGTRKVTSISEITGANALEPEINQIYKFICDDVEEDAETHRVLKIIGRHVRVGTLSIETQQRMLKAGIKKSRFDFLTKKPTDREKEEYD